MSVGEVSDTASSEAIVARGRKRVGSVDALRTIMCVGIAINHFVPYFFAPGDMELHIAGYFSYFTDVFAVLAGLFTAQHLQMEWSSRSYYDFIVARTSRLYPLHFVTMAFYVLLAIPIYLGLLSPQNVQRYTFDALIPHLTLTHAWGHGPAMAFNYPSWMISAILGCYLILPLLSWVHRASRRTMVPLLFAVLAVSATCAWLLDTEITRLQKEGLGILRAFPSFVFGLTLGQARIPEFSKTRAYLIMALSLVVVFSTPEPIHGIARLVLVYMLVYAILVSDTAAIRTPLKSSMLQASAKFSFGVYLWHGLVATILFRMALPEVLNARPLQIGSDNPLLAYGLIVSGIVAAFLLASISLRTIERFGEEFFISVLSGRAQHRGVAIMRSSTTRGRYWEREQVAKSAPKG